MNSIRKDICGENLNECIQEMRETIASINKTQEKLRLYTLKLAHLVNGFNKYSKELNHE